MSLRQHWAPLLILAALAAAPLLGFARAHEYTLMARIMILALAALSLAFLVAGAGLVSLGHAAMIGIGTYAVAILDAHGVTETLIVLPAAIAAAALFALLTGAIALRTSGVYFIMITLAFAQMAFFTASSLAAYGGDDGYTLYARSTLLGSRALEDRATFHYATLALLAATWALLATLLASRFGRILRAARENPQRAEAAGFAPYPYRLLAYAIAGALAGLAGFLLANATEFTAPSTLAWQRSGELLFMVILGGAGSLPGAILGAAAFVLLEDFLPIFGEHWKLIFGPLLILSVLFLKDGLIGKKAWGK